MRRLTSISGGGGGVKLKITVDSSFTNADVAAGFGSEGGMAPMGDDIVMVAWSGLHIPVIKLSTAGATLDQSTTGLDAWEIGQFESIGAESDGTLYLFSEQGAIIRTQWTGGDTFADLTQSAAITTVNGITIIDQYGGFVENGQITTFDSSFTAPRLVQLDKSQFVTGTFDADATGTTRSMTFLSGLQDRFAGMTPCGPYILLAQPFVNGALNQVQTPATILVVDRGFTKTLQTIQIPEISDARQICFHPVTGKLYIRQQTDNVGKIWVCSVTNI